MSVSLMSSSWDLEIALNGVSAKIGPSGFFSPAEDKLKLSDDVIEDDFTSTPDSRIWDLSPMRLGAGKTARESAKSPAEPATICRALFYARVATSHHRADGTYVAPHYQTNPNHNPYDNWSTKGNYNPFTGQLRTVTPPAGYYDAYRIYHPYSLLSGFSLAK